MFIKYQHLERFGTTEVDGIQVGTTYVFPKLDGTNASAWLDEGVVQGGSRNRHLSVDDDNANFYKSILQDDRVAAFLNANPNLTLYGEWLVPHTVKTYRDDAWRRFYIFDVFNRVNETLLSFEQYEPLLKEFKLDYVAPLAIFKNASVDMYTACLEKNVFLVKDGMGTGEGVVVKNYDYKNRYGRQVWAKIVSNEFKENHHKEMGAPIIGSEIVEQKIVDKYVTSALVDKVHAKIALEQDGWHSKCIPQLFGTVFYDLVREDTWNFVKEFKNPRIDFKALHIYAIAKVKQLKPELF